ncbi:hypothetical protein EGI22_15955 [Lacihabitans sp. LS3-19]|uniref:capsule assembly Wzi family protein n=1 Tax=Lacihabitans sp. LS3-19 TaxID=2487335 RepID=UPI0020CE5F0F|nr:capsule assembly Wzi family protein [Lacihabitans sp. LS3-19]MCP9769399.1 hypothetical protein [Lacihabitans sp. LS3-19]
MRIKLFFLLTIINNISFAQKEFFAKVNLSSKAGIILSSNAQTPFLIRSNQYGVVPLNSQVFYTSTQIKKEYDSLYTLQKKIKRFGYGYGLEPHINLGKFSQVLIPEAYAKIRYGAFEFYGGRRKEIQGLVDTTGTMGSYIWSGNALPMPKIQIAIPNYTPILKSGLIAVKGNFAHGWFGKGDSVQNVWLHQKSLYGRLGKPNWKIKIYAGLNHQVQWGGYPTIPYFDQASDQTITKYYTDFPTFFKVVTGISLNKNGDGLTQGFSANEALNRAGNHLGTIDLGMEVQSSIGRLMIYRQSIYEDGSLYYLSNIKDGLLGASLKRKEGIIQNICIEYLDTRSQGGFGSSENFISELRGRDNYFNNIIYVDSWNYRGNVIGNPLFNKSQEIKNLNTNGASNNSNYFINNRISAINISMQYKIKNITASTQVINSQNLGNYAFPIERKQFSGSQKILLKYKSLIYSANLAFDWGELRPNNIGMNIVVKKIWNY